MTTVAEARAVRDAARGDLDDAQAAVDAANIAVGQHRDLSHAAGEAWLATREHQEYWFGGIRFSAWTGGAELRAAFIAEHADQDAIDAASRYITATREEESAKAEHDRLVAARHVLLLRLDAARTTYAQTSVALDTAKEKLRRWEIAQQPRDSHGWGDAWPTRGDQER